MLPIDRRDELAELLTDQDVETLRHLVNEGIGDNTLRALTSDLLVCRPGRWPPPENPCPGRRLKRCCSSSSPITCGVRNSARPIPTMGCRQPSSRTFATAAS
ncbi:hypothetical protein ACVJBD_000324 [Rhizobium mongolense]